MAGQWGNGAMGRMVGWHWFIGALAPWLVGSLAHWFIGTGALVLVHWDGGPGYVNELMQGAYPGPPSQCIGIGIGVGALISYRKVRTLQVGSMVTSNPLITLDCSCALAHRRDMYTCVAKPSLSGGSCTMVLLG